MQTKSLCLRIYLCKKETMSLKESTEGYVEGCEGRKTEGENYVIMVLKNKSNKCHLPYQPLRT